MCQDSECPFPVLSKIIFSSDHIDNYSMLSVDIRGLVLLEVGRALMPDCLSFCLLTVIAPVLRT